MATPEGLDDYPPGTMLPGVLLDTREATHEFDGIVLQTVTEIRNGALSPGYPGGALKILEPQGPKTHRRDSTGPPRPQPQRTARAPGAPIGRAPQKA